MNYILTRIENQLSLADVNSKFTVGQRFKVRIIGIDSPQHISFQYGRDRPDRPIAEYEIVPCHPQPTGHQLRMGLLCSRASRQTAEI